MITTSRAVLQLSIKDEVIEEFISITKAARQFGGKATDKKQIQNSCSLGNRQKTYKGFKWKYKE